MMRTGGKSSSIEVRSGRSIHPTVARDQMLLLGVGHSGARSGAVDPPVGLDPQAPHQSTDFSEGPNPSIPIIDGQFG